MWESDQPHLTWVLRKGHQCFKVHGKVWGLLTVWYHTLHNKQTYENEKTSLKCFFNMLPFNVLLFIVLHFIMFTFKWPNTGEMTVNILHQINDFKKVFLFYLSITSAMVKFLNKKYFSVILLHHRNMKKMTHHYIKEALPLHVQLSVTCTSSY